MTRIRPALLLAMMLAGCGMLDQTTFEPAPEAPPPPTPVAAPRATPGLDPRAPLVTVTYAEADPDYRGMLRYAVQAAEGRSRMVQYDVVAVVKDPGDAAQGQQHAADVMRTIIAEKVPAARIHLGLRADPTLTTSQVRVYVR